MPNCKIVFIVSMASLQTACEYCHLVSGRLAQFKPCCVLCECFMRGEVDQDWEFILKVVMSSFQVPDGAGGESPPLDYRPLQVTIKHFAALAAVSALDTQSFSCHSLRPGGCTFLTLQGHLSSHWAMGIGNICCLNWIVFEWLIMMITPQSWKEKSLRRRG